MSLHLYWGDNHFNFKTERVADLAAMLDDARERIDFVPLAYYPYARVRVGSGGLDVEQDLPLAAQERDWAEICRIARAKTEPGRFVVYPGYEWQGVGIDGDHNVCFLEDDAPMPMPDRLDALYEQLRQLSVPALAIPHHTAYQPGWRSKNWAIHDEALSPFAEVYSMHGCSESDEEWFPLRSNWHMGPGVSGGSIRDGLMRGHHVGIIASTDSIRTDPVGRHGHGLMACYAERLDRQSLWDAFCARHVYGVTGDRVALNFQLNDAIMGDIVPHASETMIDVGVTGSDALDRIELLRDERVIATHCHQGTWEPPGDGRVRLKIRYEFGWGPNKPWIESLPDKSWDGQIALTEGRVLGLEPCFGAVGQRAWLDEDRCCRFQITTEHDTFRYPPTDAVVIELEAPLNAELVLEADGWRDRVTVAEAMTRSRVVDNLEHTARHLQAAYGVSWDDVRRHDHWYFHSYKVKRHRAIPAAGFIGRLTWREPTVAGPHQYRVRVEQRNGQRAWSSPIWVEG